MPYLEDDVELFEDDEALFEPEDDTEKWEDTFGEARRSKRYRRGRATRLRRQKIGGMSGGTVRTPAGPAKFNFEKPVATKKSVEQQEKEVKGAIRKIDETLDKNTSMLDKKVNALEERLKKGQQQVQQMQMMSMLPLFLAKPPVLESITPAQDAKLEQGKEIAATAKYKPDDNTLLMMLPMFMMMGGSEGMGVSEGGNSNQMMMMTLPLMFMALSDKNKK